MKHLLQRTIYALALRPLIRRDRRLRMKGKRPDQWYWADLVASRWGYWTAD